MPVVPTNGQQQIMEKLLHKLVGIYFVELEQLIKENKRLDLDQIIDISITSLVSLLATVINQMQGISNNHIQIDETLRRIHQSLRFHLLDKNAQGCGHDGH